MVHPSLEILIRPIPSARYIVDYDWRKLDDMLALLCEGTGSEVEMCPDFQRGHVWTPEQQRHYIENAIRGLLGDSAYVVSFNAPAWTKDASGDLPATVQCIDGLQRITAVRAFLDGHIQPFGLTLDELKGSKFDVFRPNNIIFRFKLAVFEFKNRDQVLNYYLDLNAGGTPHSPKEIERVRQLRSQALDTTQT